MVTVLVTCGKSWSLIGVVMITIVGTVYGKTSGFLGGRMGRTVTVIVVDSFGGSSGSYPDGHR